MRKVKSLKRLHLLEQNKKKAQGWIFTSYIIYNMNTDFKIVLYIVLIFFNKSGHCHIYIT